MTSLQQSIKNIILTGALALAGLLSTATTYAAVPDGINYQAYLADSTGVPVDTDVSITFAAYNVDVGGVPLWSQTELVSPENGLFSVVLGNPVNPFPANMFDTPIYIGLFVAGEEMLPRRALQSSAYSFKSADADTLTGSTAADLDQSADVTALESSVSGIESDVTGLLSTVGSNSSDIAANTANIATNSGNIATNDGRISTLEATGGDISSVSAGPGLIGGATSGNAVLSLAPAGVTSGNIAANAVTGTAIADGSISGADLNPSSNYTVNSLDINGNTTMGGALTIDGPFDIRIEDDFNGFRWYTSDGLTQLASIEVRSQDTTIRDAVRNRALVRSNANGIGIGTLSPLATHDVTLPSTVFTDNIDIGLERVLTTYELASTSASCHSHGNLACFYGNGTSVCPVGKRLLGGGTSGSSGLFGSISISGPVSDTTFSCGASYDIANSIRSCYAICANVD